MNKIHEIILTPINRTARNVVSIGEYPPHRPSSFRIDSKAYQICPPVKKYRGSGIDFTGVKFLNFTVIGFCFDQESSGSRKRTAKEKRWVCRCVCGLYFIKRSGTLKKLFSGLLKCEDKNGTKCPECDFVGLMKNSGNDFHSKKLLKIVTNV